MPSYPPKKLKTIGDKIADVEYATSQRPKKEQGLYRKAQQSVVDARRKAESNASLRRIA